MKHIFTVSCMIVLSAFNFLLCMDNVNPDLDAEIEYFGDSKKIFKSLDVPPLIKETANKKCLVWVDKIQLIQLKKLIDKEINAENQKSSKLTKLFSYNQSILNALKDMQRRMDNIKGTMTNISPFEIANYIMPYFLYVTKEDPNLGKTAFASWAQRNYPLLNISDVIFLKTNHSKLLKISGSFGNCINGLLNLHTLQRMGIYINPNDKENGEYNFSLPHVSQFIILLNIQPAMIDMIGKALEMCHHPALEKLQSGDSIKVESDEDEDSELDVYDKENK